MNVTRRNVLLGTAALAAVGGAAVMVPMAMRPGTMAPSTSRARPVAGQADLPPEADVVIVGAGIMGVATAFFLAEKGLSVVVCEKGGIACEQSSRAYGQVTNYGLPQEVVELGQHSKSLWRAMNARIGRDTSYRDYGRVQAFQQDSEIEAAREWLAGAEAAAPDHAPIRARFVEGAELAEMLPGAQSDWKMGLYQDDDGGMEPALAAPAVAEAAIARGVAIVTDCAVRGYETEAGAISHVVTEKGAIRTGALVVAGGTWSRLLLGNAGIGFPVLPVYLSQQRIGAVDGPPACGAVGRVVWRKEVDGSYSNGPRFMTAPILRDSFALLPDFLPALPGMLMGDTPLDMALGADLTRSFRVERQWRLDEQTPFERARIMAPTQNDGTLDESLGWLREEFPVFNQARVIERWAGTVDVARDQLPVIGPIRAVQGLFVMGGFTFGLTQGLGAGELMADLVAGTAPAIGPNHFELERITGGKAGRSRPA
ncbi:NAD(P)/FAD-dependent oxidoreductase [Pseudogemmobacter sonorensis]|uniref:NAD(P)/FAD-dependent oxidoreductase n=1 Tax=Pseudogemmobacter sonorensis TaxID=2989681 RepID=UPI0036AC1B1A